MRVHCLFIALCFTLLAAAKGVEPLVERLLGLGAWGAQVEYAVTMPQGEEVTYQLALTALPAHGTFASHDGGWIATLPGGILAYRNQRLQRPSKGQFGELFPEAIARQLLAMQADSVHYRLAVSANTVEATRLLGDQTEALLNWQFDPTTGAPLHFSAEYNPGTLTAQQLRADYLPAAPALTELSEAALRQRFPEAFDERVTMLPAFSLPIVGSDERLTHQEGEALSGATLFVFIETLTPELQAQAQQVADQHGAAIVWTFISHVEEAAPATGTALHGCRSLARDCRITSFPTLLLCNADGRVVMYDV